MTSLTMRLRMPPRDGAACWLPSCPSSLRSSEHLVIQHADGGGKCFGEAEECYLCARSKVLPMCRVAHRLRPASGPRAVAVHDSADGCVWAIEPSDSTRAAKRILRSALAGFRAGAVS